MKITRRQLRQIIKEESQIVNEQKSESVRIDGGMMPIPQLSRQPWWPELKQILIDTGILNGSHSETWSNADN